MMDRKNKQTAGKKKTAKKMIAGKTMTKTAKETMTGASILWECLEREGVKHVFGYPGGAILPAYDALQHSKNSPRMPTHWLVVLAAGRTMRPITPPTSSRT